MFAVKSLFGYIFLIRSILIGSNESRFSSSDLFSLVSKGQSNRLNLPMQFRLGQSPLRPLLLPLVQGYRLLDKRPPFLLVRQNCC